MRKPLYLKKKILSQTKVNLWELDSDYLKHKLKKKKWNFLKQTHFKKIKVFQLTPFIYSFSKQRLNGVFKNNLAGRKLVRLKYGRLKNKELYKFFKDNYKYKSLIFKLGSRLDVNLSLILGKGSIFSIRQKILHKKILLNGSAIKSPNIFLKPFDIISLKLSDFMPDNFLYQDFNEKGNFFELMGYKLFKLSNFSALDKESQILFIENISVLLSPNDVEVFKDFFSKSFKEWGDISNLDEVLLKNILKSDLKILNLKEAFFRLKLLYIKDKKLKYLESLKRRLYLKTNFSQDFNFFNNYFRKDIFEFSLNGDYLDIVFLGLNKENIRLKGNEKYLLHYLY